MREDGGELSDGFSDRLLELAGIEPRLVTVTAVEITIEVPITPTRTPARDIFALRDAISKAFPDAKVLRHAVVMDVSVKPPPEEFRTG